MAINYGYSNILDTLRDEIDDLKKKQILQYTLKYIPLTLSIAAYPRRVETKGYKYISAYGLTKDSTITLQTHSFSTSTDVDMLGGKMLYAFEFLNTSGDFSYFNIEELDITKLKVPKAGRNYNIFLINKSYVFSKILKTKDLSNFTMFSVFIIQKSGLVSKDTSELEIYITI